MSVRLAFASAVLAVAAALIAWWLLRPEPLPGPAPLPAMALPSASPPAKGDRPLPPAPPSPAPAEAATDGRSPFSPFSLLSPEATVSTQVRLLQEGDDAAFRETFLPSLRDQVTPDAIAACRKRLAEVRVQPDWEMAKDAEADGHAVQRVSMWGKGLTGFHQLDGKWLADGLWCVPYGVP